MKSKKERRKEGREGREGAREKRPKLKLLLYFSFLNIQINIDFNIYTRNTFKSFCAVCNKHPLLLVSLYDVGWKAF